MQVKSKTMKLLENNKENVSDHGFGYMFLDITLKSQPMKEKLGKLSIIKMKIFCSVKDTVKVLKRSASLGENICTHISFRKHTHRIYTES